MCNESSGPPADLWCLLFCVSAGCQAVWSQRMAVFVWPPLWTPTPPIWESWTWATIIQETQEWSTCLLDLRIQAAVWTLSGMKSPATATDSQCETLYLNCRWFSVRRSALFTPPPVVLFSSREKATLLEAKSYKWREEDEKKRWRSATRKVFVSHWLQRIVKTLILNLISTTLLMYLWY